MDAASFERVYDSLQEFHAFFAASFGRKQWRDHSGNYLQALLVQDQERRNAENLSESVGISARAMQRFLTEARWSDETVIGRLQEYLAPRLGHPEAVWVFDGSDFPKQGRKSAGVPSDRPQPPLTAGVPLYLLLSHAFASFSRPSVAQTGMDANSRR